MIKTVDLFAGAGGLSYGFLMTGRFQLVAAAEINRDARNTYKRNIVADGAGFEFIENVVGYDFDALNKQLGNNIDVVIGGPPCQGFSNANRQKNHLISMNNGLVKDYFRAIRQIRPKAFVMENVSMLSSDTHRFYESVRDNDEIDALIEQGYNIPKREDTLLVAENSYAGINLQELPEMDLNELAIPDELAHLLSVLRKNLDNERRLPNFLTKHTARIIKLIDLYIESTPEPTEIQELLTERLITIEEALIQCQEKQAESALDYIVGLQKVAESINEIKSNGLIGRFEYSEADGLRFLVNSYSVIDYVNAILGDQYIQKGATINAEWFGVPQERRRYIVIGIRRDIYDVAEEELKMPEAPEKIVAVTVGEAISDLSGYEAGYVPKYDPIPYHKYDQDLSDYAASMRIGSHAVKNHITTKTTDRVLARFKKIEPGKNFHSLDIEDKDTYAKPERTQNTIYLRLDPEKPSETVVNVRKSMWIHPSLDRAITVREAARLQSFPDAFEFTGSKDSQYQQVGNAVPPLLAKGIADIILKFVE